MGGALNGIQMLDHCGMSENWEVPQGSATGPHIDDWYDEYARCGVDLTPMPDFIPKEIKGKKNTRLTEETNSRAWRREQRNAKYAGTGRLHTIRKDSTKRFKKNP